MIIRSGLAISFPVLFSSGHPDGDVVWSLLGSDGTVLSSGATAVPPDAVSVNLMIDPALNTLLPGSLVASRDFLWTYTVDGAVVNGEHRYDIEARTPLGVSVDGVRSKLGGVATQDLPDSEISLISAYISFRSVATEDGIIAATDGGANDLAMRNAIEAIAALSLIPTMAVRVAVSEDSGTNKFKRQDIDWNEIAVGLSGIVDEGILVALPTYDPLAGAGALFILASPASDAFTGA